MKCSWFGLLLAFAVCTTLAGCGGSGPSTESVTGKVLYADGTPVKNAAIAFIPKDSKGLQPIGKTDDAGQYTLTTTEDGDGAPQGEYGVAISAADAEGKSLISEKYGVPATSGLTATVKSGSNTFDFKVDKAP